MNNAIDVDRKWIEEDTNRVRLELKRRRKQYDKFLTQRPLSKKDVIIVDDGIATGMTMFAAIEAVKNQMPNRIIVAVPIIPKDTNRILESRVDEVIAIEVPSQFRGAVGAYYQDFSQVSDAEVEEMIRNHE
ncbi:MAG TPA: phosphoribosyltransferase family protein [Atopostipes sp.]|nr:phosphoribosyltransferase family protein [Atopostipes sp.]